MRDGVYAGSHVLGSLGQHYATACDAAIECAAAAEGICQCMFRNHREGQAYGMREALVGIRGLNERVERCKTACAAIMPELRKLYMRKGVEGWESRYPSACLAVLGFAECVRSELARCATHGLPPTGFFDRQPPPKGHFIGLVMIEFKTLAKKHVFPKSERNATIVRLRDDEKMTYGEIAKELPRLNKSWVGPDGKRLKYWAVKEAYYREKKLRS